MSPFPPCPVTSNISRPVSYRVCLRFMCAEREKVKELEQRQEELENNMRRFLRQAKRAESDPGSPPKKMRMVDNGQFQPISAATAIPTATAVASAMAIPTARARVVPVSRAVQVYSPIARRPSSRRSPMPRPSSLRSPESGSSSGEQLWRAHNQVAYARFDEEEEYIRRKSVLAATRELAEGKLKFAERMRQDKKLARQRRVRCCLTAPLIQTCPHTASFIACHIVLLTSSPFTTADLNIRDAGLEQPRSPWHSKGSVSTPGPLRLPSLCASRVCSATPSDAQQCPAPRVLTSPRLSRLSRSVGQEPNSPARSLTAARGASTPSTAPRNASPPSSAHPQACADTLDAYRSAAAAALERSRAHGSPV